MTFDWSITNKKVCIFIPNFQRSSYLKVTIPHLLSLISKKDIPIIIGNDSPDSGTNDICKQNHNVYQFTLDRPNESRSGSFIRNYFIKRNQSEWMIQKDPETLVYSDFEWLDSLDENQDTFLRAKRMCMINDTISNELMCSSRDPKNNDFDYHNIEIRRYYHIHQFFAVQTKVLQNIGGYDEDFTYYGPEDHDVWLRMQCYGLFNKSIPVDCAHINHPRVEMNHENHFKMIEIFKNKNPRNFVRNLNGWGNG